MIQFVTRLVARYSHINWALADQAMVSGVNFLTGLLLARYLGLEEFGRFTLAWLVVLFASSIQHAAINSPMMSIGPKQPEDEASAYYGAVALQQMILSGLVFLLLLAGVRLSSMVFPEWRLEGLALPLAVAGMACQSQDFLRRYFFTRGRGGAAFANDALRYLGQLAVLIWLFLAFRDVMDTPKTIWVIALTAAGAAAWSAFSVERVEITAATVRRVASRHWRFSKWLVSSQLAKWASGNVVTMIAGILLGPAAVGALKAAQNLMGVVHILFQGLENIVPVRAARYFHEHGWNGLYSYLKRVTLFGGCTTAAISLIAVIAPDFWLGLVFGDQYVVYGYLLRWWAAIYVVIFLSFPVIVAARTLESTRSIFWANAVTALLAATAGYPIVEYLGLTGVVVSQLLMNVLFIFLLSTAVKFRLMET